MSRALLARLRAHERELSVVVLGQLCTAVGAFGGVKLLTALLGPAAYGELAIGMTVAGLFFLFTYGPFVNAHGRLLPASDDRGELRLHVTAFGGWLLRLSLAVAGVGALLSAATAIFWPRWTWVVLAGVAYGVANGASLYYGAFLGWKRRRRETALFGALDALLRPALAALLLAFTGRSGAAALAGYALAAALLALWQRKAALAPLLAGGGLADSTERVQALRGEALRYGLPLTLTAAATAFAQYADRWTLLGLLGAAEVGIYAALVQLGGGAAALVGGAINAFAVPIVFQRAGALGDPARVRSALRLLDNSAALGAACMGALVLVCALFGRPLVAALCGPAFTGHGQLLWMAAAAGGLLSLGQTALVSGQIVQRTLTGLGPWVLNALATLSLSLWLGGRYGLAGVVWALLLSNGVHAAAAFSVRLWLGRPR